MGEHPLVDIQITLYDERQELGSKLISDSQAGQLNVLFDLQKKLIPAQVDSRTMNGMRNVPCHEQVYSEH